MVWLEGGEFAMGSAEFYPDEAPVRRVSVDGFWIAAHAVTNDEFAAFVDATGYVTEAEIAPNPELYPGAPAHLLVPGSLVFHMTAGPVDLRDYSKWWVWTPGACWRRPLGPDSGLNDLGRHPVVHVSYGDVVAYCRWLGVDLPTETEWEYAARGGLEGARFTWGDADTQERAPLANTWQGMFPYENTELDGWINTAPVGSYPANGYGLFDMAGNVWEWTADWYATRDVTSQSCCAPSDEAAARASRDPLQPEVDIPRKVIKGGSFLCTPQYCYRYRPAARQPQMVDSAMSHLGFRVVHRNTAVRR